MSTKWIWEGIGKKGVGKKGWVRRFRVIVRPVADQELRSSNRSREENSETDRDSDSAPPHPLGGAGGSQKSAQTPTRPDQGWGCTETVPLCTDAHQRRQKPISLPCLSTHKPTGAYFNPNPLRKSLPNWCDQEDCWFQSSNVVKYNLHQTLIIFEQLSTFGC